MKKELTVFAVLFFFCSAFAQEHQSSYDHTQKIKDLSGEEIQGYLAGHGMGLAKAAELNHHPGPKHVLEMADQLHLNSEQRAKTQEIYDQMHKESVRLGKLYIAKEADLDSLFANSNLDETQLRDRVDEISRIKGELRFVHLKAHLAMKKNLSPKQIVEYDRLRGYNISTNENHQQHGHH